MAERIVCLEGLHGVGASVVNALASSMSVRVRRDGNIYRIAFERGITVGQLEIIGTCDPSDTGTGATFVPDTQIFQMSTLIFASMVTRYREMAFLNREITINLRDDREEEPVIKVLHYEGGIISFVEYLQPPQKPYASPRYTLHAQENAL